MPREVRELPVKWRLVGKHGSGEGNERGFLWYKIEFDYGAE
jgi:hypothetical protein